MPVSIHSMSVGVMERALATMSVILGVAAAHATATGRDPATLTGARLAPDMYPLTGQVQRASDAAKFAGARLAGTDAPAFEDVETTFPELQARLSRTIRFLEGLDPADIEASSDRIVTLSPGGRTLRFRGPDYLRQFALPNFYFHVTTTYAILRAEGVPLGKLDFLGAMATVEEDEPRAGSARYG